MAVSSAIMTLLLITARKTGAARGQRQVGKEGNARDAEGRGGRKEEEIEVYEREEVEGKKQRGGKNEEWLQTVKEGKQKGRRSILQQTDSKYLT